MFMSEISLWKKWHVLPLEGDNAVIKIKFFDRLIFILKKKPVNTKVLHRLLMVL